jgi:hypothetical protein
MRRTVSRSLRLLALPVIAATMLAATASSAGAADPSFPFDWKVDASTHLKKLNQTVKVPTGSFVGSVNLATGQLTGHITLPPASTTVSLAGIGLARATFQISEVQPVSGHVDLATLQATATSVFDIKVVKASPALLPFVNLVGNSCKTATPVTVTMTGLASLTAASTFTGTYTIPKLAHCGLATTALNLVVPGPGNTFTAVAAPR